MKENMLKPFNCNNCGWRPSCNIIEASGEEAMIVWPDECANCGASLPLHEPNKRIEQTLRSAAHPER